MLTSFVLLALAAAPADDAPWTRLPPAVRVETGGEGSTLSLDLGLRGRVTVPHGAIGGKSAAPSPGLTVLPEGLRYNTLFDPGFGATVETDLMFEVAHPFGTAGDPTRVGAYIAAQRDWFNGSSVTDDFGEWLSPYPMTVTTLLAGVRGSIPLAPSLLLDLRAGAGAIHFDAVEAELAAPTPVDIGLFEAGWKAAAEARVHLRYRAGAVSFLIGAGARLSQGPDAAGDVAGAKIDPGALWLFDGELGIEIGF
jgi:hypothetical protein